MGIKTRLGYNLVLNYIIKLNYIIVVNNNTADYLTCWFLAGQIITKHIFEEPVFPAILTLTWRQRVTKKYIDKGFIFMKFIRL